MTHSSRYFLGIFILILANIGFSAKAVIIKLMYRYEVDTLSVVALRMLFSAPIYLAVAIGLALRKDNVPLSLRQFLMIGGLGIMSYYVSSTLDFLGLQFVSASVERLILFTYPTMVLVLSALFLKKSITRVQQVALVLTYIGVMIAFVAEYGLGTQKNIALGAGLIFTCAFTYSIFVIGTGELVHRFGSVKFTAYAMLAATVPALIQSGVYNGLHIFSFSKEVYELTVWLVLLSTVMPTFLIVEGIRIIGAGNSSIIGFVGPVSIIVLGYIFLQEPITGLQLLGTAIVLAGVFLISVKGRKPS